MASATNDSERKKIIVINWFEDAFRVGKLRVAKWLHTTHGLTAENVRYSTAMENSCAGFALHRVQFLHNVFGFTREDIERNNEELQWMAGFYDRTGDDIRVICASPLNCATYSGRWHIVGWMCMTYRIDCPDSPARRLWNGAIQCSSKQAHSAHGLAKCIPLSGIAA